MKRLVTKGIATRNKKLLVVLLVAPGIIFSVALEVVSETGREHAMPWQSSRRRHRAVPSASPKAPKAARHVALPDHW